MDFFFQNKRVIDIKGWKKHCNFLFRSLSIFNTCTVFNLLQKSEFLKRGIVWNIDNYEFPKVLDCQYLSKDPDSKKIFLWRVQSIVTRDWQSMGSDVQHIEWVLCIDTNAVITVYFLIWCFFLYSTFLFGCYNITKLLCDQILNISIVVCVVMVMMKLQFFFILTFLYSIFYI